MPQISAAASSPIDTQPAAPTGHDGRPPDAGFGHALGQARQDHADTSGGDASSAPAPSSQAAPAKSGTSEASTAKDASGNHVASTATQAAKTNDKHHGNSGHTNADTPDATSAATIPLSAVLASALRSTLAGQGGKPLPATATAIDAAGIVGKTAAQILKTVQGTPQAGPPSVHGGKGDAALAERLKAGDTAPGNTDSAGKNAVAIDLGALGHLPSTGNGDGKDAGHQAGDATALSLNTLASLQPAPVPHAATGVPQLQISTPPNSPDFAQALSQHVAWMGNQDIQQATIHLNPRDLGPLNVNVQVNHGQVDVSFAVQHPGTVHTLQQTLPQLDTLLAQHGLSLGQAHVGHQQQGHSGQSQGAGTSTTDAVDGEVSLEPVTTARPLALGLVDYFA